MKKQADLAGTTLLSSTKLPSPSLMPSIFGLKQYDPHSLTLGELQLSRVTPMEYRKITSSGEYAISPTMDSLSTTPLPTLIRTSRQMNSPDSKKTITHSSTRKNTLRNSLIGRVKRSSA